MSFAVYLDIDDDVPGGNDDVHEEEREDDALLRA